MIISEIKGRIGNSLYMIAIGLYLSKMTGYKFAIKRNMKTIETNPLRKDYYTKEIFPYEFFKKFTILDDNYDTSEYVKVSDNQKYPAFSDFPLQDNLLISGWFLGEKYVNYETIKDIYVPSKELKEEIFDLYSPTKNTLSINVRRGDYLWNYHQNNGFHSQSKDWYEQAFRRLNTSYDKVIITSDDILWCKENLTFADNIIIVDKQTTNPKIFVDLFLPTFAKDNIISASTFSWWGAYLNQNESKKIIMPYPWNTLYDNVTNHYFYKNCIKFHNETCKEII